MGEIYQAKAVEIDSRLKERYLPGDMAFHREQAAGGAGVAQPEAREGARATLRL